MALDATQLQTLRDYLDANPSIYSSLEAHEAANTLNALTETRVREFMTGSEVYDATDGVEFNSLTDAQKNQWLMMCQFELINPADGTPGVALVTSLFGAGSDTQLNLNTLRNEQVSPATTQGLPKIWAVDVEQARAL